VESFEHQRPVFSWQMAEELAAAHLRTLGFRDATRTPPGADGGIDVRGTGVVAQVKYHAQAVGGPDVQRLRGAGYGVQTAVFYSRGGYTESAVRAADETAIALFSFDESNRVAPANGAGEALVRDAGEDDPLVMVRTLLQYAADRMEQLGDTSRRMQEAVHRLRSSDFTPEQWSRGTAIVQRLQEFALKAPELNSQVTALVARLMPVVSQIEAALERTPDSPQRVSALVDALEALAQGYFDLDGLVQPLREEQVILLVELARTFDLDPSAWGVSDVELGRAMPQ
jgi:hypothetical protein